MKGEQRRMAHYANRLRPEHRHLVFVLHSVGWMIGRPTDTGLPRAFHREFNGQHWEVKRSPRNLWRLRRKLPDLYVGCYVFPRWEWWYTAPVFDNPTAAALWFDRVGTVLLKMEAK